jgi:hypothetical protein
MGPGALGDKAMRLKSLLLVVAAGLVSAYVSNDVEVDLPASRETIQAAIVGDDLIGFVMADGALERLINPRVFGEDLICPEDGRCIQRAEVRAVRVWESRFNPGESAALIAAAPLYAPFLAIQALASGQQGTPRPADTGDPATAWMRGADTRGRFDYPPEHHPCFHAQSPARLTQRFATDEEAVGWIYANRFQVGGACLVAAVPYARGVWQDRERAMQLDVLATARVRFEGLLCGGDGYEPIPFGPPQWTDLRPGEGDPAALALIGATLADPWTYQTPTNLAVLCGPKGVAAPDQRAAREAEMRGAAADAAFTR